MARTDTLINFLTDVAAAIKAKKGDSKPILAANFDTEIANLPSGGGDNTTLISLIDRTITSLEIPEGTRFIGAYAFGYCGLTSVTIPNSVTSIGIEAFRGCTGLTSVTIPNSVTSIGGGVFSGCYRLRSVTIPDSIISISDEMFSGCTRLTSVTIPGSVATIGLWAFKDCYRLTSVTIGNGVTSIDNYTFYGCTGLTKINWNAESVSDFSVQNKVFYNAGTAGSGIDVVFGDNVKRIPAYAFYVSDFSSIPKIKSVIIGNSVTSIGEDAFENCTTLTRIEIPNNVTYIGDYAFYHCSNLAEVDMSTYTSIPELGGDPDDTNYAFDLCSSNLQIKVPSALVNSWKMATNWSVYANKIVGV